MRLSQWLTTIALAATSLVLVTAQSPKTYRGRLSTVPIDFAMQATVAGSGTVSAVLAGSKLTITGSFEGLRSPATVAQMHKGSVRGVRGPVVADLTVTKATDPTSGTISGTLDLTSIQVADLDKGRLYVQLHSEKAPEGNLWGWLLAQEKGR